VSSEGFESYGGGRGRGGGGAEGGGSLTETAPKKEIQRETNLTAHISSFPLSVSTCVSVP